VGSRHAAEMASAGRCVVACHQNDFMDDSGQDEAAGVRLEVDALMARLHVEHEEVAVLSLAASRDDGRWRIRRGSLLLGPPALSTMSWPEWAERDSPNERPFDLSVYGVTASQWREFDQVVADWRFVRFSLPQRKVAGWLTEFLAQGIARLPGGLHMGANAQPADALLNVFPHVDTPAAMLAAMAQRPLIGWVHPLDGPSKAPDGLPPTGWEPALGHGHFNATCLLVGISVDNADKIRPPHGLLVGRLRRRAWIARMHGAAPDLQTFDVHLRLDPKRISLWDLVLDLEETDDDGHLLGARRVRLADLDLPQHGADQVVVKLPTLGPRVVRRLRLYDLDGILVDAAEHVHLLERINFTLSVAGGDSMTTSIGDNSRPTLLRRLEAQDRSERQHRTLLEAGVPSRVVAAGDDGRALLTERLAAARGELLIYDAYFGKDDADWDLLRRVSVPVRVLTSVNITRSWPRRRLTAHPLPQMEILEVAPRTVPRSWLCLGRRRRGAGYQPEWPWWPPGYHRRVGTSGGHTHDAVLRELVVRQPDTSDRVCSRRSVTGRRSLHGDGQRRRRGHDLCRGPFLN